MYKLSRKYPPKGDGTVFVITPYGKKDVGGREFDFDAFYSDILVPTITAAGMQPLRADGMYGQPGVMDTISKGIQEADAVLTDMSGRNENVAAELMLSMCFGKRIVLISQSLDDIPTDYQQGDRVQKYPGDLNFMQIKTFTRNLERELVAVQAELSDEMEFTPLKGFAPEEAPGKVIAVQPEHAVVQIDGTNDVYLLDGRNVDWNRVLPDMTRKFRDNQPIRGSIVHNPDGGKYYTLLDHTKGNPWIAVQEQLEVGSVVEKALVRRIREGLGAFVKVRGDVDALLAEKEYSGGKGLRMGDSVDVVVTKIDANARRISVSLREPIKADVRPIVKLPEVGFEAWATVTRVEPGGFMLLRLPGFQRTAMLHMSRMSDEIRALYSEGKMAEGVEVYVRVVEVSEDRGKTVLADVEPPADTSASEKASTA